MTEAIITHPGSAHKDEFLACCVLLSEHPTDIQRREATEADLSNSDTFVIDVGHRHEPESRNFDHHQFPRDAKPTCSLSLILQHLELYTDAQKFCEWLEPAEWFDCRGANGTAKWLGVERDIIGKLSSPIDITLLRRFASKNLHSPGEPIWEIMKMIGDDLVDYLRSLRTRLDFIAQNSELWKIESNGSTFQAIYLPRTEPLPEEPSMGLPRYLEEQGLANTTIAMVYPDRRGNGYGLTRYNDHPSMNFTLIETEADVHFAHASGFVAKTTAETPDRLRELLKKSFTSQ
ncbi:MAG: hypothetical protein HN457_05605 [Opitutales bacterium]|jgi:hypothetical protein|nr:hypothetical protein [Opitutales bacterium]MBT5167555.1 hypothetical protein [Opitutales bacterium]MBT5815910.1 hypothetical protein [Opitutales bacterium]MBT6379760.1 hypothetical protein [Opitutales bacterium]MBT6768732.1 hypothetical protein [Opitutales bacterium]